ncbi:helix-hairpin-helix domain-containing protein [Frateuria aurantia]
MHPDKVIRERVRRLTDLPNIGKAGAGDLTRLGIRTPADLVDRCPLHMYRELCRISGQRQDPCVLDVFMSITGFMQGEPALPWWRYTAARKQWLADHPG